MRWRTAVIIIVAAWAMVMAIEVARGDEPPAAFPPGYPEAYRKAKAAGRPLVIFVDCPARTCYGADTFECRYFPQVESPGIVVGVPNKETGGYKRVDLKATANDVEINATHIKVKEDDRPAEQVTSSPLPVVTYQQMPIYYYQPQYSFAPMTGGGSIACGT